MRLFYLPRWSKDIIEETRRTLETKLGLTPAQTAHLLHQLEVHFADAWVDGYDAVIRAMANDPKDRHVLPAAVVSGTQAIVTFNLKDFPAEALAPWNIEAQSPDEFLIASISPGPGDSFHGCSATGRTACRMGAIDGHT